MDEQVQMVVHDAPGPDLDPAERGHGSDPLHDLILGFEQHRPIRDARGDVIDTVVYRHAILPCHSHFPSFRPDRPTLRNASSQQAAETGTLWQNSQNEV